MLCDDLAWTMLASWMYSLGKNLAPILRARVIIAEPFGVTDFYQNKIVNGRPCIELYSPINSELSSLSASHMFSSN
jgi:hypothetical protein